MPSSWQVRLATVLAGLNIAFGVSLLVVLAWSFTQDPGFLFAVYASVAGAVAAGGAWVTGSAISHTSKLRKGASDARIRTLAVGLCCLALGLGLMLVVPWLGLLLVIDGAVMAGLMMTNAARRELGPWLPDGAFGPRSPRAHPWLASRQASASADARPRWEQLRGEVAKGLPLWELVLAWLDGLLIALMSLFLIRDSGRFGLASGLLLLAGSALTWFLWRRLSSRADRMSGG